MRLSVLSVVLLGLTCAGFAADDDAPAAKPVPLRGCWKCQSASEYLKFEPQRVIRNNDGKFSVYAVKYGAETVTLIDNYWGRKMAYTFSLKENHLFLRNLGGMTAYDQVEGTPREVELTPAPLGAVNSVTPDKVKAVADDLAPRVKASQAAHDKNKVSETAKVDGENTDALKKLVAEVGWIDNARFGSLPSIHAFLIVQHSGDLPLMLAALPEMEKELKLKPAQDGKSYAMLYDRLKLLTGEKQRYGTHVRTNNDGTLIVLPLEDKAKIDQFRKEVGLPAFADNLKKEHPGKTITYWGDDSN